MPHFFLYLGRSSRYERMNRMALASDRQWLILEIRTEEAVYQHIMRNRLLYRI